MKRRTILASTALATTPALSAALKSKPLLEVSGRIGRVVSDIAKTYDFAESDYLKLTQSSITTGTSWTPTSVFVCQLLTASWLVINEARVPCQHRRIPYWPRLHGTQHSVASCRCRFDDWLPRRVPGQGRAQPGASGPLTRHGAYPRSRARAGGSWAACPRARPAARTPLRRSDLPLDLRPSAL